jgi:hypothetical protein
MKITQREFENLTQRESIEFPCQLDNYEERLRQVEFEPVSPNEEIAHPLAAGGAEEVTFTFKCTVCGMRPTKF